MMRKRRSARAGLIAVGAVFAGSFGVASASTAPPAGEAMADPCAVEAAPATTEAAAPATTEAATTEAAPATTEAAAPATTEAAAPVATEAPAETEPRDTVAPHVSQLDPTTAIDINEQPRDAVQQGGDFRLPISSMADNWNPNHPLGNEGDFSTVRQPLSYNNWIVKADGSFVLDTNYVLESSTSDPVPGQPFTVTYKLNPEAHWNNGDPIDVDDYITTWKALNGENPDYSVVSTDGFDRITSIEAGADQFEVVITFDDVYPDYQALFGIGSLFPAEAYGDADTYTNGWSDLSEITDWFTGPFIVDSYDPVGGVIVEVPNPNWWGDAPKLDTITFLVVSPDAVPTAFANNELDYFDIGPDPNGFALANTTPGATIRAAAGPNWRHITVNTRAGLLQDQTVRQAVVRGLNRGDIGASDLAGIPWPAVPLNNHIFMENQDGYVDNGAAYDYNPEQAASDLDAAGWVVGSDGIREKDGQKLEISFSQLVGVPVSENEAQLVQAQLAEIGIKVNIVDVPVDEFGSTLDERSFEMIAFTWLGTPFPYRFDQIFGNCSDSNYSNSYIEGFDDIVTQVQQTVDIPERQRLANEADVMLWDFVSTIPLYQRPDLAAVTANLANFGAFGFQTPADWVNVGYTG